MYPRRRSHFVIGPVVADVRNRSGIGRATVITVVTVAAGPAARAGT